MYMLSLINKRELKRKRQLSDDIGINMIQGGSKFHQVYFIEISNLVFCRSKLEIMWVLYQNSPM